jgi:chorismate synthase
MSGSSFGQAFRVTTAGESHGPGNVVIIDGCPPGIALSEDDLRVDLARRRPGQSKLVTQRSEADEPEILAGVHEGRTTGTAIAVLVRSTDVKSKDYDAIRALYRPGHADNGYDAKYGFRDPRGGGRASARETVSRVAAGAIAKKVIAEAFGGRVVAYVTRIGDVAATIGDPGAVTLEQVETLPDGSPNLVRCPDPIAAAEMIALVDRMRRELDSIGGVSEVVATGVPAGLGEPVFDKLKAELAKALFSLPAVIGVELGSGFAGARMRGSEHNDPFLPAEHETAEGEIPVLRTATNRHGGILGGISSGMPIVMRAALKPTSSLPRPQATADVRGRVASVTTKGRHDPCVLPRFVPIAEAMVAIVLADHWLRWRGQRAAGI